MKKSVFPSIGVLMCLAILFTSCSSNGTTNKNSQNSSTTIVTAPGTFPIVKEKMNVTFFTSQATDVEDYNTNEFVKWYEAKTNIHINWDVTPSANVKEKTQIKLASGDVPDVFITAGAISDAALVSYGGQGLILPLNTLIDKYAPNVKNMMAKSPNILNYMVTPSGNIYSIPTYSQVLHTTMPKKGWINKTWLDKLNLKVPTTTDEFYEVLKAFKTRDPNGNGTADEIPYAGCDADKNANNEIDSFIMQSFLPYDIFNYIIVDNGKVSYAASTPEFKEGLKFIKKLMSEGLISTESVIQDRKAITALAENPSSNLLGGANALYYAHFTVDNGPSGRYKDYVAMPVLKGPNGGRYAMDRGFAPSGASYVITKSCKYPEAVIRWADEIYDFDKDLNMEISVSMGKENIGWKKSSQGTKSLDGKQAKYELIIPFGTKQNTSMSQVLPVYQSNDSRVSVSAGNGVNLESMLYNYTNELYKPYSANAKLLPFMFFPEEQVAEYGDTKTVLNKLVRTYIIRFITGNLDIDKDWENYLKELNTAGLQKYVSRTQDVYDLNQKSKKK